MPKKSKNEVLCWPRPYLSYSQYNVWTTKGHEEYARLYIYGEGKTNPAMELGKRVAEMIEKDEEQDDPVLEHLRTFLPQYRHKEYEIKAQFNKIPLFGILDGFNEPPEIKIGEYKTGRKWTQEMADQTEQLHWYALLVHLKFGIRPEEIPMVVHWMPTEWEIGNLPQPTGDIQNFETKRTADDLLKVGAKISKVWEAIGRFTSREYRSLGL